MIWLFVLGYFLVGGLSAGFLGQVLDKYYKDDEGSTLGIVILTLFFWPLSLTIAAGIWLANRVIKP